MIEPKQRYDLLAPVPLVHLLSAEENHMLQKVAFGSEKDQLFGELPHDGTAGMRVWIYASKTGSEMLDPARLQRICFVGDFGGSTETGPSYGTLNAFRPPSAETGDSSWMVLWLVTNLQPVTPPRYYINFCSAKTKRPLAKEPRGPLRILPPSG
jgi:hypothetical protein